MSRIWTYNNWCHYDRLDDLDLLDGERLIVTFPNGETLEVTCSIKKSSYTTIEQGGHRTEIPVRKAVLNTKWKGVEVQVPLVDLEAKRTGKNIREEEEASPFRSD